VNTIELFDVAMSEYVVVRLTPGVSRYHSSKNALPLVEGVVGFPA
jgi:hypothetical protein